MLHAKIHVKPAQPRPHSPFFGRDHPYPPKLLQTHYGRCEPPPSRTGTINGSPRPQLTSSEWRTPPTLTPRSLPPTLTPNRRKFAPGTTEIQRDTKIQSRPNLAHLTSYTLERPLKSNYQRFPHPKRPQFRPIPNSSPSIPPTPPAPITPELLN